MALPDDKVAEIDEAYLQFISIVQEGEHNRIAFVDYLMPEQRSKLGRYSSCGITTAKAPTDDAYTARVLTSLDALLSHAPVTDGFKRNVRSRVMHYYQHGLPPRVVLWWTNKLLDPFLDYEQSPFNEEVVAEFEVEHFNTFADADELLQTQWLADIRKKYAGQVVIELPDEDVSGT